jgi:hypothetical protein
MFEIGNKVKVVYNRIPLAMDSEHTVSKIRAGDFIEVDGDSKQLFHAECFELVQEEFTPQVHEECLVYFPQDSEPKKEECLPLYFSEERSVLMFKDNVVTYQEDVRKNSKFVFSSIEEQHDLKLAEFTARKGKLEDELKQVCTEACAYAKEHNLCEDCND